MHNSKIKDNNDKLENLHSDNDLINNTSTRIDKLMDNLSTIVIAVEKYNKKEEKKKKLEEAEEKKSPKKKPYILKK